MRVLQTSALVLLLACGSGAGLLAQQKPQRDVPQQDSGRSPDMKQDKSTGKVDKSTTAEDESDANTSSKKKKKPHNEQSHGPQHHRPNGQS